MQDANAYITPIYACCRRPIGRGTRGGHCFRGRTIQAGQQPHSSTNHDRLQVYCHRFGQLAYLWSGGWDATVALLGVSQACQASDVCLLASCLEPQYKPSGQLNSHADRISRGSWDAVKPAKTSHKASSHSTWTCQPTSSLFGSKLTMYLRSQGQCPATCTASGETLPTRASRMVAVTLAELDCVVLGCMQGKFDGAMR